MLDLDVHQGDGSATCFAGERQGLLVVQVCSVRCGHSMQSYENSVGFEHELSSAWLVQQEGRESYELCLPHHVSQHTAAHQFCLQCIRFHHPLADDPSVFTFSVHCGDQTFPTVVQQSDWDVALPAGTGDDEYLQVIDRGWCWFL